MNLLHWFSGGDYVPGVGHADVLWAGVTLLLSALLVAGYCVIAVNWYFQSKLARRAESEAALRRMLSICLTCAVCGYVFFATDTPWLVWRLYDAALVVFLVHTWWFAVRMRGGIPLVDERLAQP